MKRLSVRDSCPTGNATPQYERVQERLREQIVRGELRPGQRLVRRTLAKEMGVSPIPVIEALHRLEQEGLVEHEPAVGARVRALTVESIREDLVLREALESQILRELTGRLGPVVLDELRHHAARVDAAMQRGMPDDEAGMRTHANFHFELARLTGCRILVTELRKVWSRRFMQMAWVAATVTAKTPPDWHERLIEALAGGDPLAADAAARFHVRKSPKEQDEVMRGLVAAMAHLNDTGRELR